MQSILSCYGLENIAYVTTDPVSIETRKPVYKVTYSRSWQEFYQQSRAERHDPAIIRGLREVLPFDWRSEARLDAKQKLFLNHADDFNVGKNGFSIPIRDRKGARALVSMTSRFTDENWQKYSRRYRGELINIAYLIHERFSTKRQPVARKPRLGDNLTDREIEALQWSALGKTSEEIGVILGVSRRSVNFHVNNAKIKLDTVNKPHAVARASALGLIMPVL